MTTAYDVASRVLTAAADGETVPGFEAVGELLIDLRTTTPVPPGTALGSSAVSVASAATTSRFAPIAMPSWVRLEVVLLSLAGLVIAGLFVFGWPRASTTEIVPGPDAEPAGGAARVVSSTGGVDEDGSDNGEGGTAEESPLDAPPSTTSLDAQPSTTPPPTAAGPVGTSPPGTTASTAPSSTAPSTTSSPPGAPTTSTAPSTTSSVDPTSTTVPGGGGEIPDPEGNNGNGNGKGVGNGKGNQGRADGDQGRADDPGG